MTTRVLKWSVPVDDQTHEIGGGRVVHVQSYLSVLSIEVCTIEQDEATRNARHVRVFGTGQEVPDDARHVGSTVAGSFVWHVFELTS